ncbi:MAG TPA: KH domain-containing protein [Candidatus Saccharimonadia bacterium]|nr:KH domain-containing protein [Candidatus Saccharimonadia bacterium]
MPELDKEFVEYVVKALVNHPEDVHVRRSVDDMGVLLELSVNPDDMGKVIGKAGATAKSIRTLLRVLGSRNDARVNLKIIEPEGAEPRVAAESETPGEVVAAVAAEPVERDQSAELLARTKQEFADLDDLDL